MQVAGSQARKAVRPAAAKTLRRAPSWGRVLATTVSLWSSRQLPRLRRARSALLLAVCVLVVGAAALAAVRLTGTSSRAARVSSSGGPHRAQARPNVSSAAVSAAAAVRSQTAAWIAGQVSSAETIGCDPAMCAALRGQGVAAGRLVPLESAASSMMGADMIVASPSARTQLSQDAPVLLASFGSGASLLEVRCAAPGGSAAYQRALQADLAARRSGGTQLLHSRRIEVSAQGAGQLEAGEVDARLQILLALLASQHSWRAVAFGDASPGVPLTEAPFRQVVITSADSRGAAADLAAALALVRAQRAPYQAAQVTTVRLPDGQAGLRIDFAAPSPLGLLTGGAPG
jgi:hypothetical protein